VSSEPKLNVLVIDGALQDREAVRLALEGGGFALQEAADAEHGLKLAERCAFPRSGRGPHCRTRPEAAAERRRTGDRLGAARTGD
jgi:hypothetical protein